MTIAKEEKCPLCKGTGISPDWSQKKATSLERSKLAKRLKLEGLTVRQIQRAMGLSSPSVAHYYIVKDCPHFFSVGGICRNCSKEHN